jgi:hypothetical protein
MSGPGPGGARLAWGVAALGFAGCVGLGLALVDAQDEVASLEAQLLVAERESAVGADEPPPRRRRGKLSPWGSRRGARGDDLEAGEGGSPGEGERAGPDDTVEDASVAAERSDAGAGTRAERALAALDVAIAELDLEPGLADEVRAIYEETFEDGARIRDELRDGERDEDSARAAQQAVRDSAREELEALLEPDELKHIRRTVRRGGRGRL